jgi:L-asparaginase II
MVEIVAKEYRGEGVESVHYGSVAVVDKSGRLTHYVGDPEFFTFARSSPKPFQMMPLIESGAADHFGFSSKQLSIMCGSHIGTDHHREVVLANLEAAGNTPDDLKCGTHLPIYMMMSGEFPKHGEHMDPVRNNCSGKHSGFLALARFIGEDVSKYLDPDSRVQQMVLETISRVYEYPKEKIIISIDGCTAPNFGMPLIHTAVAFMKLASARGGSEEESRVLARVKSVMTEYPEMFSGEGRFDLALMRAFPGNVVCKVGAEAHEGFGFADPAIGIAVKIHDGNPRALYPVCVEVMRQLGILEKADDREQLRPFAQTEVRNHRKILTGHVKAEFSLKKV